MTCDAARDAMTGGTPDAVRPRSNGERAYRPAPKKPSRLWLGPSWSAASICSLLRHCSRPRLNNAMIPRRAIQSKS